MKTAISIPNDVFRAAEAFAKRRKMSRSALYRQALTSYLAEHERDDVTARLNRVYEAEESRLDDVLARLQAASLPREEW